MLLTCVAVRQLGTAWRSHQAVKPYPPLGQAIGHINSGRCNFDRGRFSVPGSETADVAASTTLPRGKSGRIQKYSSKSKVFAVLGWLRYSASILCTAEKKQNTGVEHQYIVYFLVNFSNVDANSQKLMAVSLPVVAAE